MREVMVTTVGTCEDGRKLVAIAEGDLDYLIRVLALRPEVRDLADCLQVAHGKAVSLCVDMIQGEGGGACPGTGNATGGGETGRAGDPSLPGGDGGGTEGTAAPPSGKKVARKKAAKKKAAGKKAAKKPRSNATAAPRGQFIADLVRVVESADGPMSVRDIAYAYADLSGQEMSPMLQRRVGIQLASYKVHFVSVGRGVYDHVSRQGGGETPTEPEAKEEPVSDEHTVYLLETPPQKLTLVELKERLKIQAARGEHDKGARLVLMRKIGQAEE